MKTIKELLLSIRDSIAQTNTLAIRIEKNKVEILRLEGENEANNREIHSFLRNIWEANGSLYDIVVRNFPVSSIVNVNLNGVIRRARVVGSSKEQMKVFVDVYGARWAFGGPPSIEARNVGVDFDDIFKIQ